MIASREVMDRILAAIEEVREEPCSECGNTGDTLPCFTCHKLVCDECGDGRYCKQHSDG